MLMIIFGAGCLLLSVLFHAASLLHLGLPLLYAVLRIAVVEFANELRIMDHAPIPIDLSQFFQKEICHDTSERNRSARSL